MNPVRVGVFGVGRGDSMMKYCQKAKNAKIVAICDRWVEGLEERKKQFGFEDITFYTDFDEFLKQDMDVVMLANYATEHAPFAIKAMEHGFHVISEVLPCQTMKEAVELVEAVERTGKIYCYAENYCYMRGPYEMRRRYREGLIGEVEYAEGEYIHNCEPIWTEITYGDPNHWRNHMYSTFYCTHSIGPMIHMTGLRPVKVTGFEQPFSARSARMGSNSAGCGIEIITLENGAVIKSIHGGLYRDNIWYTLYGRKGRMETARESTDLGGVSKLYVEYDDVAGDYSNGHKEVYEPTDDMTEIAKEHGHDGSDYYTLWNAIEKIAGNPEADTIDVYEALDMFLPGMFAYRSIMAGNQPMDIPNLRDPAEREKWRHDTACTDPKVAGDMLLPCTPQKHDPIPPEVYEKQRAEWLKNHTAR